MIERLMETGRTNRTLRFTVGTSVPERTASALNTQQHIPKVLGLIPEAGINPRGQRSIT